MPSRQLAALGLTSAALMRPGLALAAQSLARSGLLAVLCRGGPLPPLASHMSDVISRHGRNGTVLFISPAAEAIVRRARLTDLLGHGLFDRVHVADRPAYLTALADAAHGETAFPRVSRSRRQRRRRNLSGSRCAADPLDQTTVAAASAKSSRCCAISANARRSSRRIEMRARRIRTRQCRQEPLPRHDEPRVAHAAQRHHRLFRHAGQRRARLPAERRIEYAKLINEFGRHLLSVVNGILDMSKMESGNFEIMPEPFSPAQAISGCCDLLALEGARGGHRISTARVPG